MGISKKLQEMISEGYDPSSWQSCGQEDDICKDTRFVVATTMPNTGLMCGGDGCVFGEWAWFNTVEDLIDYITHCVIPMHLCELEDQDPNTVMTGDGDEHIFGLPFSEPHIPIKNELQRLWQEMNTLKGTNATYAQVKTALLESDERSKEIDGELVFGFMLFDSYNDSCAELLHRMNPLDENKKIVESIIKKKTINREESEQLMKLFIENSIM